MRLPDKETIDRIGFDLWDNRNLRTKSDFCNCLIVIWKEGYLIGYDDATLKQKALAKLTDAEKEVLGLT